MFSRLPTASLRLSELFDAPFVFSIPPYQRSYAWSVNEALRLLEDVRAACGIDDDSTAEAEYFLGAILLLESVDEGRQPNDRARYYEIVDGQQRLVTLTILCAALRDLDPDRTSDEAMALDRMVRSGLSANPGDGSRNSEGLRLSLRGQEREFLKRHIQVPGATRIVPVDPEAMTLGETALLAARDRIIADLADLDDEQRRKLARYLRDNCHFVVILTEDLDRAHRMFTVLNDRGRPLQRNDILKAQILHGISPARSDRIIAQWEAAERAIGEHFEDFFSHLRLAHGQTKQQVIAGVRAVMRASDSPDAFVENEFTPLAHAYQTILYARYQPRTMDPVVRRHLLSLNRLNGSDWVPAAMLVIRNHAKDARRTAERTHELIAEIDRYANLMRLLCVGAGKRQRRFSRVVESLRYGDAYQGRMDAFAFTREEMRTIVHNLKDLYSRNMQACKMVLLRINDEMQSGAETLEPQGYSIEHVLPQRPKTNGQWREWFPDAEERQKCTVSLGNLVLVTPAQNDRARNREFGQKQEVYCTPDGPHGILGITAAATQVERWDAAYVMAREQQLLEMLARIWRIDIPRLNQSATPSEAGGERDVV